MNNSVQMNDISNHYLVFKDRKFKEESVSTWSRVWRWLGSMLGLCDNTIVMCAKKSLQAVNSAYEETTAYTKKFNKPLVISTALGNQYITNFFSKIMNLPSQNEYAENIKWKLLQIEMASLGWPALPNELKECNNSSFHLKLRYLLHHIFEQFKNNQADHKDVKQFMLKTLKANFYQKCAETLITLNQDVMTFLFSSEDNTLENDYGLFSQNIDEYCFYLSVYNKFEPSFENTERYCANKVNQSLVIIQKCLKFACLGGNIEWFKSDEFNFQKFNFTVFDLMPYAVQGGHMNIIKGLISLIYGEPLKGFEWADYYVGQYDSKYSLTEANLPLYKLTCISAVKFNQKKVLEWIFDRLGSSSYRDQIIELAIKSAIEADHVEILAATPQIVDFYLKNKLQGKPSFVEYATNHGSQKCLRWLKDQGFELLNNS